jgi:hypothetical protein
VGGTDSNRNVGIGDHPQGVGCDENGPNLGPYRLLQRTTQGFEPRSLADLDFLLSQTFGEPITSATLRPPLMVIARALNVGDLTRAMIATQLLKLPALGSEQAKRAFAAERMLKAGFDPDEPRDDRGRWTTSGADAAPSARRPNPSNHHNPLLVPAQAILVDPLIGDLPITGPMPLPAPFDIAPPVIGNPDLISPRAPIANPYPDNPECEEEWKEAVRFCNDLKDRRVLGKEGYRGFGSNLLQCIRGMVSEKCGGNPTT